MKSCLMIIAMLVCGVCHASHFYCSTTQGGSNSGSFANPYTSLSSVSSHQGSFNAGDTVSFKGGDTITGTWSLSRSGTIGNPIVINAYGTGYPVFTGSGRTRINQLFYINNCNYVTFDHLFLYDPTLLSDITRDSLAHIKIGWNFDGTSNHCAVQYCKGILIGDAVLENSGGYQSINYNIWQNMRMVVNDPGGTNDFGATPLTIATKHNNFIGNYSQGCWAKSFDFTYDGGVVEYSGNTDSNYVAYNISDSCDGFGEVDAGNSKGNVLAYNLNTNCGFFMDWHSGHTYDAWTFINNTIIETVPSITTNATVFNGTHPTNTIMTNNVYYLRSGIVVASNGTNFTHTYNRYNVSGGSSVGFTLSFGEVSSTSAMFANQAPSNPLNWDVRPLDGTVLSSGNPGGAGGYNVDLYGVVGINNYMGVAKFVVIPDGSRKVLWRPG